MELFLNLINNKNQAYAVVSVVYSETDFLTTLNLF